MKVQFENRSRDGSLDSFIKDMPAVPRIGDSLSLNQDYACTTVKNVIWCPNEPEYVAIVRVVGEVR